MSSSAGSPPAQGNNAPTIEQAMGEIARLREREALLQQQVAAGQEAQRVAAAAAAAAQAGAQVHAQAAAAGRHVIKLPAPKEFKGTMGQEVITWIRQIEHQFNVYASEYPIQQAARRIMLATGFFVGAAESWWRNMSDDDRTRFSASWAAFVDAMRERFSPIQASEFARGRLFSLRQTGSLGQYVERFLLELTPIQEELHHNDQVHHFRNGLKEQRVVQKLVEHKPSTLTDAIKLATTWDAHFASVGRMGTTGGYFRSAGPSSYSNRAPSYSSSSVPMEVSAVESHDHAGGDEHEPQESASQAAAAGSAASNPDVMAAMLNKITMLESRIANIGHGGGNNGGAHRGNKSGPRRDGSRVPGLKAADIADRRRANQCFRCGEKGHWKNECPTLHGNKSLNL
jgi:hypothetical protein